MEPFTVFRGQGMSKTNFDRMVKTQGGLLSFNNFVSTSTQRQVSLNFARETMESSDLVGILFVMKIDPSIASIPFADVRDVSYFKGEQRILFSMHAIFRIGPMIQIDGNNRLWQADLTLTGDNDPDLRALNEQTRKNTYPHLQGWDRLGKILTKLEQLNKAQDVYDILLDQASTDREKSLIYHMLGMVKRGQGKYADAVAYYQQSIELKQKTLSPSDPNLAASYNNIGLVYDKMGDYSNALLSHQKALEICQKDLPSNNPNLVTIYNNIGSVYNKIGDYPNALSSQQQALKIREQTLSSNHPDLATSYSNIGSVYHNMGDYSNALPIHQKALEIRLKILPSNHPDLATSYNNIASVYNKMGDCSNALSSHQKALEIRQKILPANHADLATSYNNIGSAHASMGDYANALLLLTTTWV
ncbi:unnamed protein product [Rotaria sp. Silwood1]|nr:unnamed protein product [Rotaria sp. Silwood1]